MGIWTLHCYPTSDHSPDRKGEYSGDYSNIIKFPYRAGFGEECKILSQIQEFGFSDSNEVYD